jgi:prolyl-tRNA synthetase
VIAYHFQAKGRDEERSRGGLLRVREFVMKDSYSYDADSPSMDRSYQAHFNAYQRIYRRFGLNAHAVESDTGAMGGDIAHEFQVLTDEGEDTLLFCTTGDYKANLERATRRLPAELPEVAAPGPSAVTTPSATTIEQLSDLLGLPPAAFLKTLLVKNTGGKVVAVILPGDRELNHAKLRKRFGGQAFTFANDAEIRAAGGVAGFIGPIGLHPDGGMIVDTSVERRGYVAGANRADTHLRDVLPGRDLPPHEIVDVHDVKAGDACPRCGAVLEAHRGVEVGNIFKFGTYYSDKMRAAYLAEDGSERPLYMCSYGIGIGRNLQTIVIEHHDDKGIVWPFAVAPYEIHVIGLPMNDDTVRATAEALVAALEEKGVEVLFDDRDDSAGVKFADADLIGIPFRVTVSKRSLSAKSIELKPRSAKEVEMVPQDVAADRLIDVVRRARDAARA